MTGRRMTVRAAAKSPPRYGRQGLIHGDGEPAYRPSSCRANAFHQGDRCPGGLAARRQRCRRADSGLPFFDHMLSQLARHGGLDLEVKARGDLEVDRPPHWSRTLGSVLGEDGRGARLQAASAGSHRLQCRSTEALVEVALDLSGRPYLSSRRGDPRRRTASGTLLLRRR